MGKDGKKKRKRVWVEINRESPPRRKSVVRTKESERRGKKSQDPFLVILEKGVGFKPYV